MVVMKVDSGELEADECEAVKQRNQNNETSFIETVFPSRQASISFDREIASTCSANRTIRYRSFYHATKHTKKRRKRVIVVQVIFVHVLIYQLHLVVYLSILNLSISIFESHENDLFRLNEL